MNPTKSTAAAAIRSGIEIGTHAAEQRDGQREGLVIRQEYAHRGCHRTGEREGQDASGHDTSSGNGGKVMSQKAWRSLAPSVSAASVKLPLMPARLASVVRTT